MKSILVLALIASLPVVAHAVSLEKQYDGVIVSASPQVSVKFEDGHIETFDVSRVNEGSITNEDYMKVASLAGPRSAATTCSRMIGELASDYKFVVKTDENELVALSFKASTPEIPVRISGDCEMRIAGEFSIYGADDKPLAIKAVISPQPAGIPRAKARYAGAVVSATQTIQVRGKDGSIRDLDTSRLKAGLIVNDMNLVELSSGGMMARCGSSLGELASDYVVTIRTKKGMTRTATLHATPEGTSEYDHVRVYGACDGNSLTQMQLTTNKRKFFELK